MRKSIQSGFSTVVTVVLLSIFASQALASQNKSRPGKSSSGGGQTNTQRSRAGVAGRSLQQKMQNENQSLKQPANLEYPNLRAGSNSRRKAFSAVRDRDMDQPDMAASKNEVSIESKKNSNTNTRRRPSFMLPEVGDEVLLRKRGQPHKQPPTRRHPHKMT